MARHIRNPKIESRTARTKLKPSPKAVFFDLGGRLHLGYRKGKGKGVWVMRVYLGAERYAEKTLGEADDLADANGVTVLNFDQAQRAARERMNTVEARSNGPVVTVMSAIETYIAAHSASPGVRSKLKHALKDEALSQTPLAALTADDLIRWKESLAGTMKPASARRIVNDLRASLNAAARRHRSELPPTMGDTIRDGLAAPRGGSEGNARKQILNDADVRRLVDAAWAIDREQDWDGDLGRLVLVLAATGARFSQVARLLVADLRAAEKRLMVPVSKKGGGGEKATPQIPLPIGDDVVDILMRAAAGRKGTDTLLLCPRWRQTRGSGFGAFEKYGRGAWGAATTLTRPWRAIVERAGLPADSVPYGLRHSSIVRGLRAGLPTRLVAALHDTSSTMVEKHYAAFISDALGELARSAVVPLMPAPVAPLRVVEG